MARYQAVGSNAEFNVHAMKKDVTFALVLAAIMLPLPCSPQASEVAPNDPVFRSPFALKLHVDDPRYYEQKFDHVPYVASGDVYLFAGEAFGVNVTTAGDRLTGITYQSDPAKADVEFKFTQEKAPRGFMMLLVTRNKLKKKLFFDAMMTVPGKTGIFNTSVLPIDPGLSNFESWPHPIVQLALRNFRFSETHSQ
ncbi:hypothetical protein [Granulicella aggregans]|uniref:hypothetical protein n=1 Tax=Granulicella aggregans TaxID=474949 RepID=UPI0021E0F10E|nr:hypothetical protein [Granulicella aggregans]